MVIAPYLTLVQEDTTITWCLKGTLHTLQGIKHLHQDERKREQVSPKVGCQQETVVGGLGTARRGQEAGRRGGDSGGGTSEPESGAAGTVAAHQPPRTQPPGGRRRGIISRYSDI